MTESNSADARLERAKRIIRGLMERTEDRGCTEAEALANAEKVSELMAQYELSLDDVVVRDVSDMVQREVYAADESAGRLVVGIGKLCSLVVYHKSGAAVTTFVMYGHAPDVELGLYLYEICAEAADVEWTRDMEKHGYSKKKRDSFRMGFADRVCDRMYELRRLRDEEAELRARKSNSTSLVVLKDQIVVAEFEKIGVRLVARPGQRVGDRSAFNRGSAAGNNVNLNSPVGYAGQGRAALR